MPRQNPLPQREKEICGRVRQARKETNLSQVAFARLLKIDSSRLASYEHARVPIRFDLALKVSLLTNISLRWLAEGVDPKSWQVQIPKEIFFKIPDSLLFSEAYERWLKPLMDQKYAEIAKLTDGDFSRFAMEKAASNPTIKGIQFVSTADFAKAFANILTHSIRGVPQRLHEELWKKLCEEVRLFVSKNQGEIQDWENLGESLFGQQSKFKSSSGSDCEALLDMSVSIADAGGVQKKYRSLPDLINALGKRTQERGQKAALARKLKVTRQAVDQWLSGDSKPSAEATLKLLDWVEQPQRKN